jgi:eukaryotic-like serine/threonine-protein kinase
MGLFVAGRYDDADALVDVLTNAIAAYAISDPAVRARTSYSLARKAHVRGDLGEMLERRREAAEQARRADDRRMICTFGLSLGDALLHLGAYAEAEEVLRVVVPQAEALGLASMGTAALLNLGVALAAEGRHGEAHTCLGDAARAFADQGDQACEATAHIYTSLVFSASGDLDLAEREARTALSLEGDAPMKAYASAALAVALLAQGRAEEALAAAGEGQSRLTALGSVEEGESQIRLAWAEALYAARDPRALGAIKDARGRLLWRAGRIRDKALQRSFLERVKENARTLALARAWVGE